MAKPRSSKSYVDALANKYYSEMKAAAPIPRVSPATESEQPLLGSPDTKAMQDSFMQGIADAPPTPAEGNWAERTFLDPDRNVGKVIDVLSQPLYATAQTMAETAADIEDDGWLKTLAGRFDPRKQVENISGYFDNYGTGNEKRTVSDIAGRKAEITDNDGERRVVGGDALMFDEDDSFLDKAGKFTAGLGADIAFDPLTYVGGGAIKNVATAPLKAARAVEGATEAGSALNRAAAGTARGLEEAGEKITRPFKVRKIKPLDRLPQEVDEATSIANRLDPANASIIERLLRETDETTEAAADSVTRVADDLGEPVDEAMAMAAATVGDAEKMADGTFVPRVSSKVKISEPTPAIGDVQGPVQRVMKMKKTGQTRPREYEYDSVVEGLLRRTKGEDDALMYPNLNPDEIPTPFYTPKSKAAPVAEVAEEIPAPVAAVPEPVDIPVAPNAANDAAGLTGRIMPQDVANAIPTKLINGKKFEDHFKIAFAGPNAREVLKSVKLADGSPAIKPLGHTSDEAIARIVAQSQKVVSQEVKAARQAAGSATPRPTSGLPASQAPTVPTQAPGLAERLARVADEGEVAKVDKLPKADVRKLGGAARKSYAKKLTTTYGVHPVHVEDLLTATTEAQFKAKLQKMAAWKTDGPMYEVYEVFLKPQALKPEALGLDDVTNVRTAAEQIEEGVAGAETAADIAANSARTVGDLSQETKEALEYAVSSSPVTQNWNEIDGSLQFKTLIDETLRTSKVKGEGYGVNRNAFNSKAQANVVKSLTLKATEGAKGLPGIPRAQYIHDFVLKGLKESDAALRGAGVEPIVGFGKSGIPFSMADLIETLGSSSRGKTLLLDRVFDGIGFSRIKGKRPKIGEINYAGTIKIDALHDAARPILQFLTREYPEVADLATLEKAVKDITRKGVSKKMYEAAKNSVVQADMATIVRQADGTYKPTIISAREAEDIAEEAVNALLQPKVVNAMLQRVHDNVARHGIRFGQEVNELTEDSINSFLDVLASPDSGMRTIAETIENTSKVVDDTAKATGKASEPVVVAAAEGKFEEVLTEILSRADRTGAQYVVSIARAVEQGLPRKALDDMYNMYRTGVSEGFHNTLVSRLSQSGDNAAVAMNSGIAKILQPLGRAFVNHWQNPTLHSALLSEGNVGRVFQGIIRKNLNEVARNFDTATLVEGMRLLQRGMPLSAVQGPAGDAARALQQVTETMFRTSTNGAVARNGAQRGIFSEFMAKGFPIEHVNSKMANGRLKLPEKYQFDKASAEQAAAANGTSVAEELSKQWMRWDIDNPIDFLGRMSAAMGGLATDSAIAMEGRRIAQASNLLSDTRRSGFVRLNLGEDSVLGRYIPESYVHPDVLAEFQRMDEILSNPAKFNALIDNLVSPITNKWKAGMTIYHPGHHIRNLIGDTVMSFLTDGVKSPVYYNRALRMMKSGNNIRGAYDEFDAIAALRGQTTAMEGGGKAAKVKVNGQYVELDDMQAQQFAMNAGILPDFSVQEDIISSAGEGFGAGFANRLENARPLGGRAQKIAGGLSEARDDFVRMAHFLHVLEHPPKGGFKSMEDAVKYAAERVRKAHPDGSDLANFERTRMRIIFPFYSWTRKAIPLIIEATFMHPGRVTQYPKAMYNYAQSNGMDLESMSEPFPVGEIFPDFLTDNMTGPLMRDKAGHSISMDFGFPQADIMNEFVADPALGVANMLNPLIKVPVEALTSSRLVSGAPINNRTEYLESNVPGLAQAGQLTGYSPTGSLIDTLKGEGPRVQDAVTKGNKQALGTGDAAGFDLEALVNRTLNVRYTDMNKPSYDRIAQMEERDKVGKAQADYLKSLEG